MAEAIAPDGCVLVCRNRTCKKQGALVILDKLHQLNSSNWTVLASSCLGRCGSGPVVRVLPDDVWYCQVQPEEVAAIVERHLLQGHPIPAMQCPVIR